MQELQLIHNARTGETEYIEVEISQQELDERERSANKYTKEKQIRELKEQLQKYKEDVEQVDLFGMERADYQEKKQRCAEIVLQLRQLESEVQDVNL